MTFDAILVGAGINDLAAAVHLVNKGWKVAVVERSPVTGGAVKTCEATLPGFRHHELSMLGDPRHKRDLPARYGAGKPRSRSRRQPSGSHHLDQKFPAGG
jgi:phytoene dehydrogenase-like protein